MKLTAVEQLVIRRKRKYHRYWQAAPDWFWLRKLLGKVAGLVWHVARRHPISAREDLEALVSIAMNWMERGVL